MYLNEAVQTEVHIDMILHHVKCVRIAMRKYPFEAGKWDVIDTLVKREKRKIVNSIKKGNTWEHAK